MALENLKSIFQDELFEKTELFQSNQPIDRFDTKLNYNESPFNQQSFGFSSDLTQRGGRDNPILDAILRGRVYEPIRFSQNFENNNLFVFPEKSPFDVQNISPDSLGLFDPRSATPKEGTLYFTTNNSFNPATNPTDFSTAGTDGSPFTPLMQLGQGLYNGENNDSNPEINMNWQSLYTNNHKNKPNASWKGLTPINYGNIVNRDKLNIKFNTNTLRDGFIREPYIVSNIPRTSTDISSGRVINFGSRDLPIGRLVTDSLRITSFLASPAGALFLVKQNLLGANTNVVSVDKNNNLIRSKQRFKSTLNPLSLLNQTLFRAGGNPISLMDRSEPDLSTLGGGKILPGLQDFLKSGEFGGSDTAPFDINRTFTSGAPTEESNESGFKKFANNLKEQARLATGATLRITPEYTGDKATLQKIVSNDKIITSPIGNNSFTDMSTTMEQGIQVDRYTGRFNTSVDNEKDGMPFYFKDMRDNAYIFFRAYIEGLTENISPSYASHNYIGRSEPVYTYERGEREISFTLKLVAQTKSELKEIYIKMDRLTSMCYPQYVNEGETGYGNRMKPPLAKLRYGELYGTTNKELMGYIKSISYAVDQSSPYETDPKTGRVPKHVIATIGYQVIHENAPRLYTEFYGMSEVRRKEAKRDAEAATAGEALGQIGNLPSDIPL